MMEIKNGVKLKVAIIKVKNQKRTGKVEAKIRLQKPQDHKLHKLSKGIFFAALTRGLPSQEKAPDSGSSPRNPRFPKRSKKLF